MNQISEFAGLMQPIPGRELEPRAGKRFSVRDIGLLLRGAEFNSVEPQTGF
jgi:hypothetical protein